MNSGTDVQERFETGEIEGYNGTHVRAETYASGPRPSLVAVVRTLIPLICVKQVRRGAVWTLDPLIGGKSVKMA
ncbi:hypothetical protein [Salibacterium salarium]|uniref:hypothetical protein n=1 Tax=Salibacterium salarium TaxID=284579 RepID=UPI000F77F47E|nr:hypothetical protein [Salibacterium salarium]